MSTLFGFNKYFCVLAIGSSGGLLLLWKDDIDINVVVGNPFFINYLVCDNSVTDSCTQQLTFVYEPPFPSMRPVFWDDLNLLGDSFTGPWLMAGDFNSVLSQKDKSGGKLVSSSSIGGFRGMVDKNALIDLGFVGHTFTWTNRSLRKSNIQERFDRCFANGE